jgi:hypothetical protein
MDTSNHRSESYAYFALVGNERYRFDPRAVTERTGLTPSASWRRGDVRTYVATTECKMQLWIDDVDPTFASEHFGVSAEWDERGSASHDIRVAYIFASRQLLFASNLMPLPQGDESPTIDAWIASSCDLLVRFPLPRDAARTFVLSTMDRGAGGGFHLEPKSVRRIAALDAAFRFRLDTQPAQQFSIGGRCWSCNFNVLTNESER